MSAGMANGDLGQSLTVMVVLRTRFFSVTQKDLVLFTAGEEQDQFRGRAGRDLRANTHSGVGMGHTARECHNKHVSAWHVPAA